MPRSNSDIELPSTYDDACKWVFEQLHKLHNQRRNHSTSVSEIIREAKSAGFDASAMRLAMQLDRMSPEKRELWANRIANAARLFGYTALGVGVDPPKDDPQLAFVKRARQPKDWQGETSEQITLIKRAAREAIFDASGKLVGGAADFDPEDETLQRIPLNTIMFFINLKKLDDPNAEKDRLDEIDHIGALLRYW